MTIYRNYLEYVEGKLNKDDEKYLIATMVSEENENNYFCHILLKQVEGIENNSQYEDKQEFTIYKKGAKFKLFPYVEREQRNMFYIFSTSGTGKSYFSSHLIRDMQDMHTYRNLPVYLISSSKSPDKNYNIVNNFMKLNIYDPNFLKYDAEKFKNSIVVFDDYERNYETDPKKNKNLDRHILNLIEGIAEHGRKLNIHLFVISHLGSNYNRTRGIINEAEYVTIFLIGNRNTNRKFMKSYLDFDKSQIEEIEDLSGRTCIIRKKTPFFYLSDYKIKVIN